MAVVVNTPEDVTPANYRRVAYGGESVEIGRRAYEVMEAAGSARPATPDTSDASPPHRSDGSPDASEQAIGGARRPVQADGGQTASGGHGSGGGVVDGSGAGTLDEAVVRGVVFARLTNLLSGYAPVRPEIAERVAGLLSGPMPKVPLDGEVGAGEALPLSRVLEGLDRVGLDETDESVLLGGSPCSASLVADAALRGRNRLASAEAILALSVEAFRAPLGAYDVALDDLYGDAYEARALRSLRSYLEGAGAEGRRFHQAPVSYRILPRVLGQVHRAVAALEKAAAVSLRSVTLDFVQLPPDDRHPSGRMVAGAGSHNAIAYPGLNALSAAWADLAFIAERQVTALNTADTSDLPLNLAVPDVPRSGTYAYGWAASSFVEEARAAATPALLPSMAGDGIDDISSPTFSAYRRERRAAECLDGALTILALVSSQALFVTGRTPPAGLSPWLSVVRTYFPPIVDLGDRDLSAEAALLQRVLAIAAVTGDPFGEIPFPAEPPAPATPTTEPV